MTGRSAPEFSLAYLTVMGEGPERMIEIAAETGYDFVSLRLTPVTDDEPVFPFLSDPSFANKVKRKLAQTNLSVLDVELIRVDPDDEPEDFLPFVEVSAELGARHIVTQIPETDLDKAVDQFARVCAIAEPFNLTVDLEFIPWSATVDLARANDIVTMAAMPNGGILVDTLHFARSDSSLELLSSLPRNVFNAIQLCDGPTSGPMTTEALIHAARRDRLPPGDGGLGLWPMIDAMPRVPYSLEVPNDAMRDELGVTAFARTVLESAQLLFATNGLFVDTQELELT